ncbi:balbiani ring protein 3-like [Frankliniella occidentalis]|uniref:Balbiani ring protein 3-like n=1 Tax=Frankliniella occidentalis TaxID=133901 RepID=A0A6J1TCE6_FRAOC|nr:balbiani ring protein 3-like [Frankliniella occidentalis]
MLIYVVLAAALPLALACPCPPAPAASEVCGSDLVTYPSQCNLQCAAVPGLSLKHAGPCSPVEEEDSAAQQTDGRDQSRRSATEEKKKREECKWKPQCLIAEDCGCRKEDSLCHNMCWRNCDCSCAGYPRGGVIYDLYTECWFRAKCDETYRQCKEDCGGQECEAQCWLDNYKCECECVQEATASQWKLSWDACLERDQCHNRTCSECTAADPADELCAKRCERKCQCACAGHPRRDLSGEWEECFIGTQSCEAAHRACAEKCIDQECRDKCHLESLDCSCVCRSAPEAEWRAWGECKTKEQCKYKRCSSECLEGDKVCKERCQHNCECRCFGINADNMEDDSVKQCTINFGCQTKMKKCLKHCDTLNDKAKRKECVYRCSIASEKCHCECARSRPPKIPESEERVEIIQHCNFIC